MTIEAMLAAWADDDEAAARIVHVERVDPLPAVYEEIEPPVAPEVAGRLASLGVTRLYRHQAHGIRRVREGRNTVVVAGTASGKSLVYQVPIAEAVERDPKTTALLLFPTKALAQDQLRSVSRLGGASLVAAAYDGDTDPESRRWIRHHANVVLTNPDMLHVGILPSHARWRNFFHRLEFVVVDELHVLRGIFGSHVAHVLRRLRRVAHHYGAHPTFVFTSATIGNPGELAERLIGIPVEVVDQDTSPSGARTYVLWNPELEDAETGRRAGSLTESTRVFVDLVSHDLHTLVFSRSRKASELMYRWARERLDPERAGRIAAYRGGYLAEDRRRIEQALFSGELLGVTATNALELGIDVGGLDAAVITTFPGTIASFRQQAGRSGRNQREALVVLVAGQDALDQYYVTHPGDLFARPAEAAVINPANPEVLAAHAGCAAHEIPLIPEDRRYLGEEMEDVVPELVAAGDLAVRGGRLLWAGGRSPAAGVDIRTSGGPPYVIADQGGALLGSVDEDRAFSQCHAGAVYLHQGETYVVERLDLADREVRVRRGEVGYYTQPKVDKDVRLLRTEATGTAGRLGRGHGWVEVETHVLAYQRKEIGGGRVIDTLPLDLPSRTFRTQAFWYTFPDDLFDDAGAAWGDLPGILHAAEHTAIAVMPIYAMCDRWDIGGLSTAYHADAGGPVFYIYDGYPGGAGIAPIGYAAGERHLRATLAVLDECPCLSGCPSCVQSPKCGNFNEPLDKDGAARVLRLALAG